jgi:hypothetical protein
MAFPIKKASFSYQKTHIYYQNSPILALFSPKLFNAAAGCGAFEILTSAHQKSTVSHQKNTVSYQKSTVSHQKKTPKNTEKH